MNQAENILDLLTSAIVLSDRQMTVLFMNQTAHALFGRGKNRSIGKHIGYLFKDREALYSSLENRIGDAIEKHQPSTTRETSITITASGEELTVNNTITPLGDGKAILELQPLDRIIRINREGQNLSLHDTTRQLVRNLAHEVKNPLGGIRGAAQLLNNEIPHEQKEYTNVIISEVDRLRTLVDSMLGPGNKLSIKSVNVHKIIEHVLNLAIAEDKGLHDRAEITFTRKYDPSIPEIQGDTAQLIQALLNVVKNAVEALSNTEEPRITVCTDIHRNYTIGQHLHRLVVEISIIDNGPGIPAHLKERIFYPMISGRELGSGIGLSMTQSILARHNGLIDYKSVPTNTHFSLYLPVERISS